jgi:hypothetical protein
MVLVPVVTVTVRGKEQKIAETKQRQTSVSNFGSYRGTLAGPGTI